MEEIQDPQPWKVLKSEYLFRRPWLTARKDCVQLPNGVVNDEYYVLEYPTWVNVIARTVEGKYIFIRQYRHGLGQTNYEIVAGTMDPTDKSPEEAARRELYEEAGYGGGQWRLLSALSANASAMNNLSYSFVAEGVEKVSTQHLEPTEEITVHLLDETEVRHLLEHDEIKQALMAAPLWKYLAGKAAEGGK
ncbi:MAG: NUDIX hydrolase [Bacteroidales bacterium]|nr:NUDIX hydrolase [Bacteroidales bacterium]